jgi:hypothetical protein
MRTHGFPAYQTRPRLYRKGGGADYHDQGAGHWIDDHIATPMSKYPEYRQSRQSFGINVLGTLVVEIEAEDGTVGFAVTTGGEPACYIVESIFRFLEGRDPTEIEKIWDQMYFSTQYYGRKGLVVNAISGVDLACGICWASCAASRSITCWAARCVMSCSSTPPARGPMWPRNWASSAARWRCTMAGRGRRAAQEHRDAGRHAVESGR